MDNLKLCTPTRDKLNQLLQIVHLQALAQGSRVRFAEDSQLDWTLLTTFGNYLSSRLAPRFARCFALLGSFLLIVSHISFIFPSHFSIFPSHFFIYLIFLSFAVIFSLHFFLSPSYLLHNYFFILSSYFFSIWARKEGDRLQGATRKFHIHPWVKLEIFQLVRISLGGLWLVWPSYLDAFWTWSEVTAIPMYSVSVTAHSQSIPACQTPLWHHCDWTAG